ncbi:MAG: hypothetical protein IJR55_06455 [Clostridia bacterium]|nr:hypothetical protein [Clostridia bacterium]
MNTNNHFSNNSKNSKNLSNKKSVFSSLSDACGGGGVRYNTVKSTEKKPLPLLMIVGAVVFTVLFMFIIFTFVQISDLSSEVSKMKNSLNALSSEEQTLKGQLDYKYSQFEIESTSSQLGLSSKKNTTVYFESEESADVSEVIEPENTLGSKINTLLGAISKNFEKLIDFLN